MGKYCNYQLPTPVKKCSTAKIWIFRHCSNFNSEFVKFSWMRAPILPFFNQQQDFKFFYDNRKTFSLRHIENWMLWVVTTCDKFLSLEQKFVIRKRQLALYYSHGRVCQLCTMWEHTNINFVRFICETYFRAIFINKIFTSKCTFKIAKIFCSKKIKT